MSIPLNKEVFEEYMEACLVSPTPRVCMAPGTVTLLGLMESFKSWCDAKKKPIYGRLTLVEFSRIVRACGFEDAGILRGEGLGSEGGPAPYI